MASAKLATAFIAIQTSGIKGVQQDFQSLHSSLAGQMQSLVGLAGKISAVVAGAGFLGSAVQAASAAESAETAFSTLLGSAEKGKQFFEEMQKFSLNAPFESGAIQKAAQVLLGFQFTAEETHQAMSMLGDVAAATGADFDGLATILGQVRAKGKLQQEEALQFAERGIAIQPVLAKMLGVTTAELLEMQSQGKVTYEHLAQAFEEMTKEGGQFFNGMANASKTFQGQMRQLSGLFSQIQAAIGVALIDALQPFIESGKQLAEWLIQSREQITALTAGALEFGKAVLIGAGALKVYRIAAMTAALSTQQLRKAILGAFAATGIGVLVPIVGELLLLLGQGVAAIAKMQPVQDALAASAEKFGQAWSMVQDAMNTAFAAAMQGIEALAQAMGLNIGTMPDSIGGAVATSIGYVADFAVQTAAIIKGITENWDVGFDLLKNTGMLALSALVDYYANQPRMLVVGIAYALGRVNDLFMWLGKKIVESFGMALDAVVDIATRLPGLIAAGWAAGGGGIGGVIQAEIEKALAGITDLAADAAAAFAGEAPDLFNPSQRTLDLLEEQRRLANELIGDKLIPPRLVAPDAKPKDKSQGGGANAAANEATKVAAEEIGSQLESLLGRNGFVGFADQWTAVQEAAMRNAEEEGKKAYEIAKRQLREQEVANKFLRELANKPPIGLAE